MRIFTLERGQFKGEYKVYASREEFRKEHPEDKLLLWSRETDWMVFEAGEWVESNDGWIVQVLKVSWMTSRYKYKKGMEGKEFKTRLVRFPMSTASIYRTAEGKLKFSKFYAVMASKDESRLSPTSYGIQRNNKKIQTEFASLLLQGVDPFEATKILTKKYSYGYKSRRRHTLIYNMIKLLGGKVVRDIMKKNHSLEFQEKMLKEIELSEESLIDYIKDFMRHVRKGSQTHLNSIPLLLDILGYREKETKSKNDNVEEAKFEEVAPPELGE